MLDQFPQHDLAMVIMAATTVLAGALLMLEAAMLSNKRRQVERDVATHAEVRAILEAKADELERLKVEIDGLNKELDELERHAKRVGARTRNQPDGAYEFVHEIGKPESANTLFTFRLQPRNARGARPENAIFHASIWKFKNTAHMWSIDPGTAAMVLRSIFNEKSGVDVVDGFVEEPAAPAESGDEARAEAGAEARTEAGAESESQEVTTV